jgi:hypothetical protein
MIDDRETVTRAEVMRMLGITKASTLAAALGRYGVRATSRGSGRYFRIDVAIAAAARAGISLVSDRIGRAEAVPILGARSEAAARSMLARAGIQALHGTYSRQEVILFAATRVEAARQAAAAKSEAFAADPSDPRHGRTTGYKLGCRCEKCSTAIRRYRAEFADRAPAATIKHGTISGYAYRKCRCDECTAAARKWHREHASSTPVKHGTIGGYFRQGCRCELCQGARRSYASAKRQRG